MKVNDREQEFVFRYFQSGKLDTQKALRKVKARGKVKERSGLLARYRWMAVAASLAPGVAVVLEGELAEARAASFLDGRPRRAETGGKSEIKVSTFLKVDAR